MGQRAAQTAGGDDAGQPQRQRAQESRPLAGSGALVVRHGGAAELFVGGRGGGWDGRSGELAEVGELLVVDGADGDADRWLLVVGVVGPVGGLVGHRASLGLAGRPLRTLDRVEVAGGGMPAGGLAAVAVGERPDRLGLAVLLVAFAPAGLHSRHRTAGQAPCLLSFGVVVLTGLVAEGPVGVADLVVLAVVLHQPGGLPPRPPTTHRLGHGPSVVR